MKRLLLPLIVLLALVLVYFMISSQRSQSVAPDRTEGYVEFNPEQLDSLIVTSPQQTLNFVVLDGRWNILIDSIPRPADPARISEAVDMICRIDVGRVESNNPDKQSVYKVDSVSGTLIQAFEGDQEVASFILGKNAQDYNHSYIRKTGSNDVYSAKDVMVFRLDKSANNWRDKSLMKVDSAQLSSVTFQYNNEIFSLDRQDSLWYVNGDKLKTPLLINQDSIEVYKRLLADFKADDFYQPADSEFIDYQNPELILTMKYITGREDRLIIYGGNVARTRFYIRPEGLDEPYVVLYAKYADLTRRINNFVPTEKNG